jgi:trans-aconitate 2-methyltransferase
MPAETADWDGIAYHRVSEPQFAWGRRVLVRLDLNGDETVLDAGCGSGRLTAEVLDRLPRGHVIAVDHSASMLAVAERELRPRYGDRVTFLQTDLLDLDLDATADVVFSTATFHWVLDHPRLFAVLHRALRPGGRLHAQCGATANLARAHGRAERLSQQPEFAPYFTGWTSPWEYAGAETTRLRLERAGFIDVDTSIEPALTVFENGAAYREFIRTVIMRPFLAPLPEGALRERMLDGMCAEATEDDPPWSLDYWRLNMAARRPASTPEGKAT